MKKLALMTAAVFAATGAVKAATVETLSAELEKAGFTVATGGHQPAPKPGLPQPVHQQPGGNHPSHPANPSHPAHPTHPGQPSHPVPGNPYQPGWHPQPQPGYPGNPAPQPGNPGWHPQPGYPTHPAYPPQPWQPGQPQNPGYWTPTHPVYPPVNPPYNPPPVQLQQQRFESGSFVFSGDARRSMENAAEALQRARYTVLEKRLGYNSYTLVFLAPSHLRVEKYASGAFTFASDAQRAADDCVSAMESQGKIVLERNVNGNRFTVSYLGYGNGGYMQTQTYASGVFTFSSDAQRSMNEAVAALQDLGAVLLEKRLAGNSYTLVFQAPYRLEFQTYASGNFVFSSDAQRALADTAAALQGPRGFTVVEKRMTGNSYNVVFIAPFKVEFQKYASGSYTFASDAQRAAAETAAAFASQGMKVVEKNVSGTQFTITYFHPGYYY